MGAAPRELLARESGWADLDPRVSYAILRLRCEVFVVEQHCAYLDVDGRDVEPAARHHWLSPAGDPADVHAYLRVLHDPGELQPPGAGAGPGRGSPGATLRIGRVVTAPAARGQGLSQRLVADVVARRGRDHELVLDAQSQITHVYSRHGFTACGPDVLEDGIPHTPMRRPAG